MERIVNLKKLVKDNDLYRKVVLTGRYAQLVVMSLEPGAEIPEEVHPATDQLFLVQDGRGEIVIGDEVSVLDEHAVAFVPAGMKHTVRNPGRKPLKLSTIYSPPVHASNVVEASAPKTVAKV